MSTATDHDPRLFEDEAARVLTGMKQGFSTVLVSLGVRRPVELQRMLKLDPTLSCQIFKLATESNVLAAGSAVPSRLSMDKFCKGSARNGVPAEQVQGLSRAFEQFEAFVDRHAGDRASYNSLITAAAGLNDEWLAADLQHRRNMYRGQSHAMGVQAQSRFYSTLVARDGSGEAVKSASVSGYVGLRVLRAIDSVRVFGLRTQLNAGGEGNPLARMDRKPLVRTGPDEDFLLEEFCTQPLPKLKIETGSRSGMHWVQTSAIRPQVGNAGMMTLMFGQQSRLPTTFRRINHTVNIPSQVVIQDLMIQRGLADGAPTLQVFLGDDVPADREPDLMLLAGDHRVEFLGRGAESLATLEVPRCPEMATLAAARLGCDIGDFEMWRVRLEFPMYHSTSRMYWPGVVPYQPSPTPV